MKKNENNSVESPESITGRLFNGIKNSLKNFSKKSFGKLGLFLIFGVIVLNISVLVSGDDLKFYNIAAAQSSGEPKLLMSIIMEKLNSIGLFPDRDSPVLKSSAEVGKVLSENPLSLIFKALLWGLIAALGALLKAAGLLFDLAIDQEFFRTLIDNKGLYTGWVIVRDVLNMFFMLLLLFSAFATIFQVEKYHLRKMIIMLVVMALLANFSFPITRFVIDFSNSAMYFLSENLQGSAAIARFTNFGGLLEAAASNEGSISSLLLTCIFLFILICTIFAIAINLLIRILIFALLIVVSPAGFVLAFFPGTKNVADDWWSYLFKYAFMGPVMMFFLYLAVLMFDLNSGVNYSELNKSLPGNFAAFIVPTVFLWIGLGAAQKFGGSGSAMAMNFAKKTGSNIKSYGQKAAWGGFAATGIPGAAKERYNNIKGKFDGKREEREAKLSRLFGSKDAMDKLERKNYEEDTKKMKNFTVSDLETKAKTGNVAAANELLSRKALNEDVYNETIKNSKDTKRKDDLTAKFKGASKENRIDVVASIDASDPVKINAYMTSHGVNEATAKTELFKEEMDKKFGGLNHVEFAKQDWKKIFDNIAVLRTQGRGVDADAIKNAIEDSFLGLDARAVAEITKNINSNQASALRGAGII